MECLEVVGVRLLYDAVFMASNIPKMSGMIRHILVSESCTVLRTMFIAAALADAVPAAGARGSACGDGRATSLESLMIPKAADEIAEL